MKIHRYIAKDMRQALQQVREAQGPDAVILSTRRVDEGVEVVAAVDYDSDTDTSRSVDSVTGDTSTYDFTQLVNRTLQDQPTSSGGETLQFGHVTSELNALRRMLETQLASLAWNDLTRRAPVHTEVLKELTKVGVTPELAAEFVSKLPAHCELAEGQRLALALLAHRIVVAPERWIDKGGVVAMVGSTGVGKTLTLAKLAARWVMRHGAHDLALVSTDCVRIGAHDQIHSIGRLLGVPCYSVDNLSELNGTLSELKHRKMVLVDTAGLSQRDQRLNADLGVLAAASSNIEFALVLSANSQAGAIEETLTRFAAVRPKSCVLTKLDEAASLGGVLSAVIRAQLPIAYVCDGQRLTEDVKPARAHQLVINALQLSRKAGATADEDLLSRRFGGISHAIA